MKRTIAIIILLLTSLVCQGQYKKSTARLDRVRLVYVAADTLNPKDQMYWPIVNEKSKKRKHDQKTVWGSFALILILLTTTK